MAGAALHSRRAWHQRRRLRGANGGNVFPFRRARRLFLLESSLRDLHLPRRAGRGRTRLPLRMVQPERGRRGGGQHDGRAAHRSAFRQRGGTPTGQHRRGNVHRLRRRRARRLRARRRTVHQRLRRRANHRRRGGRGLPRRTHTAFPRRVAGGDRPRVQPHFKWRHAAQRPPFRHHLRHSHAGHLRPSPAASHVLQRGFPSQ